MQFIVWPILKNGDICFTADANEKTMRISLGIWRDYKWTLTFQEAW